jgi:hypothetical protein
MQRLLQRVPQVEAHLVAVLQAVDLQAVVHQVETVLQVEVHLVVDLQAVAHLVVDL